MFELCIDLIERILLKGKNNLTAILLKCNENIETIDLWVYRVLLNILYYFSIHINMLPTILIHCA